VEEREREREREKERERDGERRERKVGENDEIRDNGNMLTPSAGQTNLRYDPAELYLRLNQLDKAEKVRRVREKIDKRWLSFYPHPPLFPLFVFSSPSSSR